MASDVFDIQVCRVAFCGNAVVIGYDRGVNDLQIIAFPRIIAVCVGGIVFLVVGACGIRVIISVRDILTFPY